MTTDIDEVKEIIARSGNSFHSKVLKHLRDKKWTVLISPYYNDNISGKPREIDLVAEKLFDMKDMFSNFSGYVNVRLFIECKYIPQKTVFWFHDIDDEQSAILLEQKFHCRRDNFETKKHHYKTSKQVAKLFADEKSKTGDNEIFYKALNQSLNGMVNYRSKPTIIRNPRNQEKYIKCTLNYPIIVCNSFDNLYGVQIETEADPYHLQDNFQLEVNYAYINQQNINLNEYFLLDVVNFSRFDDFLESIKVDSDLAAFFLNPG
ncbi:hypothetical protein [Geothrix campi]|uniref:hypothetical protein n=1 Tax=Geothrix campi TaxID=2966450 RepID=UPI0021498F6B|nr:hypothetical protein [Geothrix sp. SG10]